MDDKLDLVEFSTVFLLKLKGEDRNSVLHHLI